MQKITYYTDIIVRLLEKLSYIQKYAFLDFVEPLGILKIPFLGSGGRAWWSVWCSQMFVVLCVCPQERRKEFEANLEKAGLELETEDKAVREAAAACCCHLMVCLLRYIIFYRTLSTSYFESGLQRPKDAFLEDPCSVGCARHLRRCLEDQSSLQRERLPSRSRGPTRLDLTSFPPAGPHHEPAAGLFHLPL